MMAQKDVEKRALEDGEKSNVHAPSKDLEVQIVKADYGTAEKAPLHNSEVPAGEEDDSEKVYPPFKKAVVVMIALYLSLLLVSLVSCLPSHKNLGFLLPYYMASINSL